MGRPTRSTTKNNKSKPKKEDTKSSKQKREIEVDSQESAEEEEETKPKNNKRKQSPAKKKSPVANKRKSQSPNKKSNTKSSSKKRTVEEESEDEIVHEDEEEDEYLRRKKKNKGEEDILSLFKGLVSPKDVQDMSLKKNKKEAKTTQKKEWSMNRKGQSIQLESVSKENVLRATHYGGDGDISVVQAEHPLDTSSAEVSYFEITIERESEKGEEKTENVIYVGRVRDSEDSFTESISSCGYSSDGKLWTGSGSLGMAGKLYGQPFSDGDVVGCGLIPTTGSIFYTLNGLFMGVAARINPGAPYAMYPSVSFQGPGRVRLNYGQRKFHFNVEKPTYRSHIVADRMKSSSHAVETLFRTTTSSPRGTVSTPLFSPKASSRSPLTPKTTESPIMTYWNLEMDELANRLSKDVMSGLFSVDERIPLPMTSANVRVTVVDFIAELTVTHTFLNNRRKDIEGMYYLPVSPSSVTRVSIETRNKVYQSKVQRKRERNEDDLVSTQDKEDEENLQRPEANVPQDNGTTLVVYLKKIGAGKTIRVITSYTTTLVVRDAAVTLALPAYLYPRYSSHWNEEVYAPHEPSFDYESSGLSVQVDFNQMHKIQDVLCASQKNAEISFGQDKKTASFKLQSKSGGPMMITLKRESQSSPQAFMEYNESTNTTVAMVTLVPAHLQAEKKGRIIVVDASNPTNRAMFHQIKLAARLLLSNTPNHTSVQLILLDGDGKMEKLYDEEKKFDQEYLDAADVFLDKSRKGKKKSVRMRPLMEHIQESDHSNVFFLLSSKIEDLDEIEEEYSKVESQFFPLGIAGEISEDEIKRLSHIGCGTGYLVFSPSQLKAELNEILNYSMTPSVHRPSIEWEDFSSMSKFESVPRVLPSSIYPTQSLVALCRASGSTSHTSPTLRVSQGRTDRVTPSDLTPLHILHHWYRVYSLLDLFHRSKESEERMVEEAVKQQILFEGNVKELEMVMKEREDKSKKVGHIQLWFENISSMEKEGDNLFASGKLEDDFSEYTTERDIVGNLLLLQRADGSWALDEKLLHILKIEDEKVVKSFVKTVFRGEEGLAATSLVCSFLEWMKIPEKVYYMFKSKAMYYLEHRIPGMVSSAQREATVLLEAKAMHLKPENE
ncbi:ran-binding protein 10-like [Planoprotostelium fungivorum]|uniref:Ran-binding protein 10-like n=1 Tax=Planoprotostelium fungivorum TaxID=1890364 RepID=A0A2P6MVI1_9EUKA|nr:ran-binding protein 10-like [Planoprotostelium fungivorum]